MRELRVDRGLVQALLCLRLQQIRLEIRIRPGSARGLDLPPCGFRRGRRRSTRRAQFGHHVVELAAGHGELVTLYVELPLQDGGPLTMARCNSIRHGRSLAIADRRSKLTAPLRVRELSPLQ